MFLLFSHLEGDVFRWILFLSYSDMELDFTLSRIGLLRRRCKFLIAESWYIVLCPVLAIL